MLCRIIATCFTLFALTFVQAAPATTSAKACVSSCSPSKAVLSLPAGQTAISVPTGQTPTYVALGVGIQNYTCSSTGTYTSIGAVATLYDISCFIGKPGFATLQNIAYGLSTSPMTSALASALGAKVPALGHHYFVTNPVGTGVSPYFEVTNVSGASLVPALSVIAKKAGSISSPTSTNNVDWLELANVQGSLAKTVFRVDTIGGQPPASCTANSTGVLSVKYAAKYWIMN